MDDSTTTYRLLTADDIPGLEEILLDDDGVFDPEQVRKFMETHGDLAFGAIVDHRIIGLVYGYTLCQIKNAKPQFFVYSAAVHSDFRDRGYGTALFRYAVSYCREHGYAEVFVPTDRGNPSACRVYEKAGGKSEHDNEIIYVIDLEK